MYNSCCLEEGATSFRNILHAYYTGIRIDKLYICRDGPNGMATLYNQFPVVVGEEDVFRGNRNSKRE